MTEHLKDRGYQAEGLHGDLTQHQRDTVMNLFRGGRMDVLIATDVAARGIDVDDVEAVFNYDVPEDIEYYVHRIGRTGRAGKTGRSFTLVSGKEVYKIRDIERVCHTKIRERNIPSAADITSVKAEKILGEALETMQNKNLDSTIDFLMEKLVDGEYTALDLAAAFMKMKMGDDIKDIKVEKFNPKDLVFGRSGSKRGKRGGRGRSSERDRGRRSGEKERSKEKDRSKEKERSSAKGRSSEKEKGSEKGKVPKGFEIFVEKNDFFTGKSRRRRRK